MRFVSFPRIIGLACFLALLCGIEVRAQTGTIRGHVTDAETGRPLPDAHVVLRSSGDTTGVTTDADGRFEDRVPGGAYRVIVTAVGYEPRRVDVDLAGGETEDVSVALRPRTYSLNEIVVQDRSGRQARSTSTVQRVEPQSIERQDAADVSELAPLVPATHVQTNSRGQTILYFRNAGDRQVGQFFDGALLNIPWDNRVDISLIPASVVEEITVTKGVPSIRYGANVLGGAINFQSRTRDASGHTTELRAALGTEEQRRASVTHVGRTNRWDYTAAVQYNERGDQALPSNVRLQNNQPSDDRRINTDRTLMSGFGRAGYRLEGGGEVGLSILHVDAEQGVAPEGNVPDSQTRYWRYPLWQKSTVIASGRVPVGTKTIVRGAAWGSRFAQDIAQYDSIDYADRQQLQEGRDRTGGLRLVGTQTLPTGSLTLALNGLTSRHTKRNRPSGTDSVSTSTYRQNIFSTGLEYDVQLASRVQVSAGVNLDGTSTPRTGPFPARDPFYAWGMTSGIRIDLSEQWAVRGAAGRKSRFPTMRELFGAALGKFVPNPNLSPVTAWIGEVGAEHESATWGVGLTPFYARVNDTIDKRTFQQGPNAGKEQRINLKGARIYGVEATARWTPVEGVLVDGNLTWSRPRSFTEAGDTQKLDEKPAWLGTGTFSYEVGFGLSVMSQARYTGGIYARNEQNQFVSLPSSLILDARLSYDLGRLLSPVDGDLYLRGENLTDDARFIGLGLPGPGRSLRIGVDVTL